MRVLAVGSDVDEGDAARLIWSLDQASLERGLSIDGAGRIEWTPREDQASAQAYSVTVTATDPVR